MNLTENTTKVFILTDGIDNKGNVDWNKTNLNKNSDCCSIHCLGNLRSRVRDNFKGLDNLEVLPPIYSGRIKKGTKAVWRLEKVMEEHLLPVGQQRKPKTRDNMASRNGGTVVSGRLAV